MEALVNASQIVYIQFLHYTSFYSAICPMQVPKSVKSGNSIHSGQWKPCLLKHFLKLNSLTKAQENFFSETNFLDLRKVSDVFLLEEQISHVKKLFLSFSGFKNIFLKKLFLSKL